MTSLLRSIAGFIIAAFLIAFALFNRTSVDFTYSPFHPPVHLPLYLIALLMFALGFLIGGVAVWLNSGEVRKTRRRQKKQIKALEKELTIMKTEVPETSEAAAPAPDLFPALPSR